MLAVSSLPAGSFIFLEGWSRGIFAVPVRCYANLLCGLPHRTWWGERHIGEQWDIWVGAVKRRWICWWWLAVLLKCSPILPQGRDRKRNNILVMSTGRLSAMQSDLCLTLLSPATLPAPNLVIVHVYQCCYYWCIWRRNSGQFQGCWLPLESTRNVVDFGHWYNSQWVPSSSWINRGWSLLGSVGDQFEIITCSWWLNLGWIFLSVI